MRKIIFMGEKNGYMYYFDKKNKRALKSQKQMRVNMDNGKYAGMLAFSFSLFFTSGSSVIGDFVTDWAKSLDDFYINYGGLVVGVILLQWTILCVYFLFYANSAYYKPLDTAKLANLDDVEAAIENHYLWDALEGKKKVTIGKKFGMTVILAMCWFVSVSEVRSLFCDDNLLKVVTSNLSISEMMNAVAHYGGDVLCIAATILMTWITNPLSWVNAVEKYEKEKEQVIGKEDK